MAIIYSPEEDSYLMQEILKKEIPKKLIINPELKFLEVGCGSGINLQTAKDLGIKNLLGTDINKNAIEHCKKLGFEIIHSDLFERIKGKFDVIIFNPPYLPEDKKEDKESKLSTTGGKKGSEIINKFLLQAKKHLEKNANIFLLTSSLTKGINWKDYHKELIVSKKLFFEELFIWKLNL